VGRGSACVGSCRGVKKESSGGGLPKEGAGLPKWKELLWGFGRLSGKFTL